VAHGSTGFLADPGDVATFRHRLEQLLLDASLRDALGTAGRRRFENEFTVEAMLSRTAGIYRSLPARCGTQAEAAPGRPPVSSRPTVIR